MTPAAIFALVKDAVIVAALGVILYLVYRAGSDHVKSSDLTALHDQIAAQGKQSSQWRDQFNDAQNGLKSDMAKIAAAASAPIEHQWVYNPPSCQASNVLSSAPSQTASSNSSAGSVIAGSGSNAEGHRRDAVIAAYKARWETVLASCRAEDQTWPK